MKRLLFLLIAILACQLSRAHDFAVANSDGVTIYYTKLTATTVAVSYQGRNSSSYSNEYTGCVVIPSSVTYSGTTYSVTSIGEGTFSECTSLTSVTIPNSVTSIGKTAFSGCYDLRSITIPNSVTSIGIEAFYGCTGLTSVTIPNSVTSIGNYAFEGCTGLTSVTIPNSVTSIGKRAFGNCSGLTYLYIADGDTELILEYYSDNASFYNCKIEKLYVGRNLSSWSALCYSSSLQEVEISDFVTSIGSNAFKSCTGLTSVTIPNSVTSIDQYAFDSCSGLTWISLGNSITSIGDYAFRYCSGLTSVSIPSNTTTIGTQAFYGCSNLKTVINKSPNFIITAGSTSYGYLGYYANVVSNIADNLKYDNLYYIVEDGACTITGFTGDTKKVVIPNAIDGIPVTKIGISAFSSQSILYSIEIPSSVTAIGNSAFSNCSNLNKVVLMANTVPEGFGDAFTALPERMTYTGNHNYDDYSDVLGNINVYTNLSSKFEQGGVTYVPEPITRTVDAIDCDYSTVDITIPGEVNYLGVALKTNSIKNHALRGHSSLEKLTIGGSVATIGDYALTECTSLADVTFESGSTPISVGSSGSDALLCDSPMATLHLNRDLTYTVSPFRSNKSLKALFVGGECTQIQSSLFTGCSNIETISVSGAVESIGSDAFYGLEKLTDVSLNGNNLNVGARAFMDCTVLANLVLDTNVAAIGDDAFRGCSKIRSTLRLGQEVDVTIGSEAFMDCSAITSFTLGANITAIGDRAFKNCALISKLNLCEKITSIGSGAFAGCAAITSVAVPSKITVINDSTFMSCSALSNITLPTGLTSLGAHALDGTAIQTLTLPEGVTELKDGVVANTPLQSFRVTSLIRSIGDGAFDNCTLLADLTIEKSATKLQLGKNAEGEGLFYDCKLDNLSIARPLEYSEEQNAGYSPFYGNKTLKNATISDNTRTIGALMFGGCTNLETATLGEDVMQIGSGAFAGSGVITINIPSKVTIIPANCFENCARLETLTIPETVKSIDVYAFAGSGLKSLTLPSPITIINDHTFYNTKSLESLTINNGLVTIDTYAFAGSGLMSLTIPNSVKTIKTAAFDGAFRLADLSIENGTDALTLANTAATKGLFDGVPLKNVYIGRELNYEKSSGYGYSPFYRNTTLQQVELGDIPAEVFAHEFDGCTALLNVTLGDAVKKISEYGFAGCSAMESFVVGASITTISDEAFSDCTSLVELRSYAPLPPVCGNQSLADINKFQCTLYIPNGSTSDYSSADQWQEFFFVEEFDAGVKVSYIEMSQNNSTMKAGETLQLSAVAYPETAMLRTVSWSSSNTDVASVSSVGLVTANRAGIAEIQATAADGSGVKGICRITVVEDDEPGVFRFEISNTDVYPDVLNRVPVRMYNESAVTAFQCDVILPTGISLAQDEYGDFYIEMAERAQRHQATINETNGVITIAVYHMSNAQIEGSEGTLFYLPLEVTGDERSCTMSMRNIHLSKVGNIDEELTPISAVLNVQPRYVMGDANGDGKVSVTDFTTVISYIVNNQVSNFVFAAADMDGDGRILIADATAILSKSLVAGSASGICARRAPASSDIDALTVGDITFGTDGIGNISIRLDGATDYIACQMDIILPEGLMIENAEIGSDSEHTHSVIFRQIGADAVRVIACSMNNDYFGSDNVINLSVKAKEGYLGGDLNICNALAVAKAADCTPEVALMSVSAPVDPGLSSLYDFASSMLNIHIEGHTLTIESPIDTCVTIANVMGQSRRLDVHEGINTFTLPTSGIIIINNKKYIIK